MLPFVNTLRSYDDRADCPNASSPAEVLDTELRFLLILGALEGDRVNTPALPFGV